MIILAKASLNFAKCKKPDLQKQGIFCSIYAHFFKNFKNKIALSTR